MQIRKMKPEDMERVLEITTVAWGENTLHKLLEDRHGVIGNKSWQERKVADIKNFCQNNMENVIVAIIDEMITGYATYGINKNGTCRLRDRIHKCYYYSKWPKSKHNFID